MSGAIISRLTSWHNGASRDGIDLTRSEPRHVAIAAAHSEILQSINHS